LDNLKIKYDHLENEIVISLSGSVTSLDALEMKDDLLKIIEDQESVILDISHISNLDLTGFNALLMTNVQAKKKGKPFKLKIGEGNLIKSYMRLTKLADQFQLDESK
jgi:anti-anti-sigma factor